VPRCAVSRRHNALAHTALVWREAPAAVYDAPMTHALKKAFEIASALPDPEQDALAAAILEEVASDERWEASLAASAGALEVLADEALREHRAGRTKPLDPDRL
jgi:hypothetical protein